METIFILNLSQETFFRYTKNNVLDLEYNKILSELVTKPEEILLKTTTDLSHWDRKDKIIFVPKHLMGYVEKKYGEIMRVF
jgi:hypothetical protein